ncbi:NAD-glutamate dehydrogenase [Martelella lutilitoris]|uniref:NAD-glutamate dehydrogenase n=1 Tax=Martelella lutilitoris TaxID=2583532 RepID=A0A5C4JM47_9HYPH|nr:NAD-glutamate dehydrogenase [Martelella lutilitoris]TNB46377.1 NAD-glutamate dehydrogenase [Martelella lutilitoris]
MENKADQMRKGVMAAAEKAALATGEPFINPFSMFERASPEDLARYDAAMLAEAAVHAAREVGAFDGGRARVSVGPVSGIAPSGIATDVIAVTDRNMPFIYDSVIAEIGEFTSDILLAVHPILIASPGSTVTAFSPEIAHTPEDRISHVQVHVAALSPEKRAALKERLDYVMAHVRLAVNDWPAMLDKLETAMKEIETRAPQGMKASGEETRHFLEWLRDGNFTFLGMRELVYTNEDGAGRVEHVSGSSIGILSDPKMRVLRRGANPVVSTPEILAFLEGPELLLVTKANTTSIVHRRTYMDYIGVKRFGEDGRVVGELRIVGLFTFTAYTQSAARIPLLRAKLSEVSRHFGFEPKSHAGRMLQNILESYPRDELFQVPVPQLTEFAEQIMDVAERPRIRVLSRIDGFDRFVSVLVYIPRNLYDARLREKVGEYLAEVYQGHVSAYYPSFPEGRSARVQFIIGRHSEEKTPEVPQADLEAAVRKLAADWSEHFRSLAGPGAPAFDANEAYHEAFSPEDAVADLPLISSAAESGIRIAFYRPVNDDGEEELRLKIFHAGGHLALSRRVPLLENLGFTVISERTFDLALEDNDAEPVEVILHDMELLVDGSVDFDLEADGARLEEAFAAAFSGSVDNDSFNRLVLLAGLDVRQVNVLRAYAHYLRQAGVNFTADYIAQSLCLYPVIARALFLMFRTAFDPALSDEERAEGLKSARGTITEGLEGVPNLDDDRILRLFVKLVDATLRTNYFQTDENGAPRPNLAFKFASRSLAILPEPRPFREIFLYGPEVEGVHLRFGKVARGGLRWSDRGQDYRTEVLGLVKAQQVKNAVIVPVGAKGGFYPKKLPPGGSREEVFTAGREAYKSYIRTLLSITDNIEDGKVVPPSDTVRCDDDDPYFVVAADKGTATFSDTANALAQEADFWLDDAFASGGSAGYDHKKMGITARGAWEAVKRHFREMNVDIQTTPFTVVGVGDMSGDVFGNGMLLSEKIRLVAAFDHRDIFIDPEPDTAGSFAERKRLFDLPRSSWQDYDRSLMSEGGMIISRREKAVKLTPQAAAAIGLAEGEYTPFDIISAILKAKADLLWFGGIGTYIKARSETNAEVGDRANDPIRINAEDLRVQVIGEGANLGVTQKGRIAFGLKGGRCNSDAIDNSAGVNCSDVEVNIKIALASAMRSGRLSRADRDVLLAEMTEAVADIVLENNYLQTLSISLSNEAGLASMLSLSRMMEVLEKDGHLDRTVETLPDDEALRSRRQSEKGLTRAETGVLLSYGKIVLFDQLLESGLPDDPYMEPLLYGYFPERMREAFAEDIGGHRLRREIIATRLANDVINRGGPEFVINACDMTAATPAEVVKAAIIARDGFGMESLWQSVHALDGTIDGKTQNAIYAQLRYLFGILTHLLIRNGLAEGDIAEAVGRLKDGFDAFEAGIADLLPDARAEWLTEQEEGWRKAGVPDALAASLARHLAMMFVPEALQIASRSGRSLERAADAYFSVTKLFHVSPLLSVAARMKPSDFYDSLALARSMDQISASRRDLAANALLGHGDTENAVVAWREAHAARVQQVAEQLERLARSGDPSIAKTTVAAGLLNDLARDLN